MSKILNISIQRAGKDETFEIAKGLPDFFNENGLNTLLDDLQTHMLHGAYSDKKIIGFITVRKADVHSLEISWLAVQKDFQKRGIGSRLVKDVLTEYAREGFQICYVKTLAETTKDDGYERTRSFYKALGFNTLEIIDPYPGWSNGNPCQILAAALPLR